MKVVLDANVYLSALFSPQGTCAQILRKLAHDKRPQLVTSEAICAELLACFKKPKILKLVNQPESSLIAWFDSIQAIALKVNDTLHTTGVCRDPKDEIYLSAAIASKASYLVTGDKDLLVLESIEQTLIVDPGQFLRKL